MLAVKVVVVGLWFVLPGKKPALCEKSFEGHGGDVREPERGISLFEQR